MIQQRWTCPQCGHEYTTDVVRLPVHCRCGQVDRDGTLVVEIDVVLGSTATRSAAQVGRAIGAFARWAAAGFPTRPDEQVQAIFTEQCSVCPLFRHSTCTHKLCGCQIRDISGETTSLLGRLISTKLANKLRWLTERCPDEKW